MGMCSKRRFIHFLFTLGGPYFQNKKGEWLANFTGVSQFAIRDTLYTKKKDGGFEKNEYLLTSYKHSEFGGPPYADVTAPVNSYYPNDYGLYNMAGNVEEFVREKGITKGGSWHDTGYYLQNHVYETYDSANEVSATRGFRFVMEI